MSKSAIEWTTDTWNPVTGCDRVSPGCAHCYALDLAARLKRMGQERYQRDGDPRTSGPGFGVTLHRDKLDEPLRWRRPRRVFVNSMSDLFHQDIPDEYIAAVFSVMATAEQHIFQVLTKRPERMRELLSSDRFVVDVAGGVPPHAMLPIIWPLPNVWLGVSIENRRFGRRADHLRRTPAARRFISAEPLLGSLGEASGCACCGRPREHYELCFDCANDLCADCHGPTDWGGTWGPRPPVLLHRIDWLIAGGESGQRHHRPARPEWVRELRDRCQEQEVAFFFKQWGGRTPKSGGRELDGRTWDEYPAPLLLEAAA